MLLTLKNVQNLFVQTARDQGILKDERGYRQKIKDLRPFVKAHEVGLVPTPYFWEALAYAERAKKLQVASLAGKKVPKVGDPLMEAIPIYNTVQRRYAGFSNVPELLWYGVTAPKLVNGQHGMRGAPVPSWRQRTKDGKDMSNVRRWLYLTLAHRITGSGASFEHDHGFRNNRVFELGVMNLQTPLMADMLADYDGPIFTSLGNQIPPFPKCGGREYLRTIAPELVTMTYAALMTWKTVRKEPVPIKQMVDMVLKYHTALGCKQFKFVLTAWVMDIAEYLPHLVDPTSDCYHGKNAIEAIEVCFDWVGKGNKQVFYDAATRIFANATGTHPMDVEDAAPGCDFIRWLENYVPKKGFDHVREKGIFNGSSLTWPHGRQPSPF